MLAEKAAPRSSKAHTSNNSSGGGINSSTHGSNGTLNSARASRGASAGGAPPRAPHHAAAPRQHQASAAELVATKLHWGACFKLILLRSWVCSAHPPFPALSLECTASPPFHSHPLSP